MGNDTQTEALKVLPSRGDDRAGGSGVTPPDLDESRDRHHLSATVSSVSGQRGPACSFPKGTG